jgi:acetylornithine deacetylase
MQVEKKQMNVQEQALLDRVESLRDSLVAQTQELVRIPTVNPFSGDPVSAGEAAGQAWVEKRFRELGATTRRVPVPADIYARCQVPGPPGRHWNNRENVVAEWNFGAGGSTILLNSHMDTVGVAGMSIPPFDPVIKGDVMYGRGSTDTKGSMMTGLIAIQALRELNLIKRGRILYASVVDEECSGGGAGTMACCEAGVTGDVAIVLDGGRGQVVTGCNGISTAWLTVKGRQGHSSYGTAISAIDKGIVVKQAIDAFMTDYAKRYPGQKGTVGVFKSGTLPSNVPGEAILAVNLKYALAEAVEAERVTGVWGGALFRKKFEAAMAALGEQDPWFKEEPVAVSWTTDLYPYETDAASPLVRTAVQAATDATGVQPAASFLAAWYDGARLSRRLRIPVIGLGHGTHGQAHTSSEQVLISDLVAGARTVALTLLRLMTAG